MSSFSTNELHNDYASKISQRLFELVKPFCTELSQQTSLNQTSFNESRVLSLLVSIETAWRQFNEEMEKGNVVNNVESLAIAPKLADYIFFPISSLLKQPLLSDSLVQHILAIIDLLIQYCWKFDANYALMDQLLPLVLFLSGAIANKQTSNIGGKSLQFKLVAINTLSGLANILGQSYFEASGKRLHFLSDSLSLSLDVITSTKAADLESIEVLNLALDLILLLLKRLSPEQVSMILPGLTSSIAKFVSLNSSNSFKVMVKILHILGMVITQSFNDTQLNAQLEVESEDGENEESLLNMEVNWDDDISTIDASSLLANEERGIHITEKDQRTMSWLKATSKQLRMSLIVVFKTMLLNPTSRSRLNSKPELSELVITFIANILQSSFVSLFLEVTPLMLDLCVVLLHASLYEFEECNEKIWQVVENIRLSFDNGNHNNNNNNSNSNNSDHNHNTNAKTRALRELVKSKLDDLLDNKLSQLVFSTDEDKIAMTVMAIKFYFPLFLELSRRDRQLLDEVVSLKKQCLRVLLQNTVEHVKYETTKRPKSNFQLNISAGHIQNKELNLLDSIELPGYINARNVKVQDQKVSKPKDLVSSHDLQLLARQWETRASTDLDVRSDESYIDIKSPYLETCLKLLIKFLSELKDGSEVLDILEQVFEDSDLSFTSSFSLDSQSSLSQGIALWFAGLYATNSFSKNSYFDTSEFLNFGDAMDTDTEDDANTTEEENESAYLMLMKAKEVLDEHALHQSNPFSSSSSSLSMSMASSFELAHVSALEAIRLAAGCLLQDQYRTDVLMQYLLAILQCLTLVDYPRIQGQAHKTLQTILNIYYSGSMVEMIIDNLDYLIDSISMQMSVASNLTPALPGILMIIIKIAGVQLLQSNQLTDVLSDMFVLLDSYHTYNKLAETFFFVFETLVDQIKQCYIPETLHIEDQYFNNSKTQFNPWGMTTKEEMIAFIEKTEIDPYGIYESEKEYFTRPGDKPFSEMRNDSDDEEEEEEEEGDDGNTNETEGNTHDHDSQEAKEKDVWISPIPKESYEVLKRIFKYGFTLLTQPLFSLKFQIVKTLRLIYPLLCTDYKLVLPIVTAHWPVLTSLVTGATSLSIFSLLLDENDKKFPKEKVYVTVESLKFATEIINYDLSYKEYFFSRKYEETLEFILKHSHLANLKARSSNNNNHGSVDNKTLVVSEKAIYMFRMYPQLKEALIEFLLTGVQCYGKTISDLTRLEVIQLCFKLGIPQTFKLSRDTSCVLEVVGNF